MNTGNHNYHLTIPIKLPIQHGPFKNPLDFSGNSAGRAISVPSKSGLGKFIKIGFLTWSQFPLFIKNPTGLLNIHAINLKDSNGHYGRKGFTGEPHTQELQIKSHGVPAGRGTVDPGHLPKEQALPSPFPPPLLLASLFHHVPRGKDDNQKENISKPFKYREH